MTQAVKRKSSSADDTKDFAQQIAFRLHVTKASANLLADQLAASYLTKFLYEREPVLLGSGGFEFISTQDKHEEKRLYLAHLLHQEGHKNVATMLDTYFDTKQFFSARWAS